MRNLFLKIFGFTCYSYHLSLAGVSQDLLALLDLKENNLKMNFCSERHFTQLKRGEIGEKWRAKMVVTREAGALLDLVQFGKLWKQAVMAYLMLLISGAYI